LLFQSCNGDIPVASVDRIHALEFSILIPQPENLKANPFIVSLTCEFRQKTGENNYL